MINLSIPENDRTLQPRITVVGVGGAGGNAVNNMIRSNLKGVEFLVTNTDSQALAGSEAERKVQLGITITQGLGAGAHPDTGRAAAEEAIEEIGSYLQGSHMVFITAGMGGGTGTGAAPVIARAAREFGILTVGVVTKPFHFEGAHRMRVAEAGINELQQYVDTLIVIPNQNLFRIANEKTTFADAFRMADEVLHCGVRGVTDLMVMPGEINLDFSDIRTVMSEMGKAMMGTGEGEGESRSVKAAEAAISNPLLDDVSMKGARAVLINVTCDFDLTVFEVDEAVNRIRDEVDQDANIIFGTTYDQSLEGVVRVSVVATGIEAEGRQNQPVPTGQRDNVTPIGPRQSGPPEPRAMPPAAQAQPSPAAATTPERAALPGGAPATPQTARPAEAPRPAGGLLRPAPAPGQPSRTGPGSGHPAPQKRPMAPQPMAPRPMASQPMAPRPMAPAPGVRPPVRAEAAAAAPMPRPRTAMPMAGGGSAATAASVAPLQEYLEYEETIDFNDADEKVLELDDEFQDAPARPQPRLPGRRSPSAQGTAESSSSKVGRLFRRVSGLSRDKEDRPPPPVRARPQAQPARSESPAPGQRDAPLSADRTQPLPRHEDDELEIPAFLRRQAN